MLCMKRFSMFMLYMRMFPKNITDNCIPENNVYIFVVDNLVSSHDNLQQHPPPNLQGHPDDFTEFDIQTQGIIRLSPNIGPKLPTI